MTINDVIQNFSTLTKVKLISNNEIEIKTQAVLPNSKSITIFLTKNGTQWNFNDKKLTLKYMNDVYDLKAIDVKKCISSVLKIYKFKIDNGEILAEVHNDNFNETFYNYLMCIGQLTNMYAFFDNPE